MMLDRVAVFQVCWGKVEHVPQRRGSPRGKRPRRAARRHLRQPSDRGQTGHLFQGASGPGNDYSPGV